MMMAIRLHRGRGLRGLGGVNSMRLRWSGVERGGGILCEWLGAAGMCLGCAGSLYVFSSSMSTPPGLWFGFALH
jgi:hypothetical protein